jgi:hypothetical protein
LLLLAADLDCRSITDLALIALPARHKQPTPKAVQVGLTPTLTARLCRGERILEQFERFTRPAEIRFGW